MSTDETFFTENDVSKPKYIEPIDQKTRVEIIGISAKITEDIPHSILMGGIALRILYEVRTGKTMFNVGKGDYDIYLPADDTKRIDLNPPQGYTVNQNPDFHKPWQPYIVLNDQFGNH